MKKIIFFAYFFILLLLVNQVSAIGFMPSNINFNLKKGEKGCQIITINSDSNEITVTDQWADNKDSDWKVDLFKENSDYNRIIMDYPKKITKPHNEVNVCITGNKDGEFHGVVLLKEEQVGSSVIQAGVWIKAIIGDPSLFVAETTSGNITSKESEVANNKINNTEITSSNNNNNNNNSISSVKNINITSKEDNKKNNNLITGAVIGIGDALKFDFWKSFAIFLAVIIILIAAFKVYHFIIKKSKDDFDF